MVDEEKQLENIQEPPVEVSEASTENQEATTEANSSAGPTDVADVPGSETDGVVQNADADSAVTETEAAEQGEFEDQAALVEKLTQEIESLKAQVEDRTGQYMRIAADFDNFRKRTQKEREELEQKVKCSTIGEILPVIDNFERARSQIKPQTDSEMNIHKSYQSVYKQLVDCLKRIGVAPMRAEGKEFDPNMHEAVMRESTDEYAEGTVIEELMRGYLLGDRVLRHAMVKVAAAPETVVTSEEGAHNDVEDQ